ncbi:glycosyltransferase [Klebsiella pneumoniae subsp. ozaenae]|uniref:Glycosyltransferase n=1 Tax=Klebsiella pneumoniae subsp. ozaenae TaxID=574 RepID=A0A377YVV5_KLEPO|nr:glycosyltransferase [Klebsiella pneumoniae subsp. ozaenae]
MLVLSSDSEGFGNVVVEALLLHTPVASTRCPGGVTEILTGELPAVWRI